MTALPALSAFLVAAGLLTVTPGLDTMLVLRTAATEGRRAAAMAALGIQFGCLVWGATVALGLGALLLASRTAYAALIWAGAAYLVWIGLSLLLRPNPALVALSRPPAAATGAAALGWLRRGALTNLLNPKIGVFYVSFLPQFVPAGWAPAPTIFCLAALHGLLATAWLGLLIAGTARLGRVLRRSGNIAWLDRVTGLVLVSFGLTLALGRTS